MQVSGIFLPGSNDLGYSSDIGYTFHSGKTLLQKLHLGLLKYTGDIDLTDELCVPVNAVFLPIGELNVLPRSNCLTYWISC